MSERESFDALVLERKVDSLLEMCARLQQENRLLKENHARLHETQHQLQGQKDMALHRIKGMIHRMRSLEKEL